MLTSVLDIFVFIAMAISQWVLPAGLMTVLQPAQDKTLFGSLLFCLY